MQLHRQICLNEVPKKPKETKNQQIYDASDYIPDLSKCTASRKFIADFPVSVSAKSGMKKNNCLLVILSDVILIFHESKNVGEGGKLLYCFPTKYCCVTPASTAFKISFWNAKEATSEKISISPLGVPTKILDEQLVIQRVKIFPVAKFIQSVLDVIQKAIAASQSKSWFLLFFFLLISTLF